MAVRQPKVFVVGAGPVATALAFAMRAGGMPVLGLWGRRPEAVRQAASSAGVVGFVTPPDVLLECDVVIMAVREEGVMPTLRQLTQTGLVTDRHVLLHCSGVRSAATAFDGRPHTGTLHPLRAIPSGKMPANLFRGAVFGVEGAAQEYAALVARAIGGLPLPIASTQLPVYHAAAALASNYVVALLDVAIGVMTSAGLSRAQAAHALAPLAVHALAGSDEGPERVLTGPVRRGDVAAVRAHLASIGDPVTRSLYEMLARAALAVAERAEPTSDWSAMRALLHHT